MTQSITELCLIGEKKLLPFAVIVEQGDLCAWALTTDYIDQEEWAGHVLKRKERRENESWTLEAWAIWLSNISEAPLEARSDALSHIGRSTPGVVVRRPREAHTRLPVMALARLWQRRRLHDRAETIAANVANRLASKNGQAHWRSSLRFYEELVINPDWIIERCSQQGETANVADGLSVIHVIDAKREKEMMNSWTVSYAKLGSSHPYAVAVIRNSNSIQVTDYGCCIGDRFNGAEALAVSLVLSKWAQA